MPANCIPSGDLRIFLHHIYELQKGVRNMVLCTLGKNEEAFAIEKLQKLNIDYVTQYLSNNRMNLFFGSEECLEVIRMIINKPLNQLSPEEDFILGVLLGYDVRRQCERYCHRKKPHA